MTNCINLINIRYVKKTKNRSRSRRTEKRDNLIGSSPETVTRVKH